MRKRAKTLPVTNLLETKAKELASESADPAHSLPTASQAESKEVKRLQAEAKKSVRKTRARLLSEQASCLHIRSKMLPTLREIAQFARRKGVFPRATGNTGPTISSTAREMPEVFFGSVMLTGDWSISAFQSLLQGMLPQTADELRQLIIDLPEVHLQTRFGLVWSYDSYVSYDDYKRETTCGIEVIVVYPNVLRINDLEVKIDDLRQTDFESELTRAFYAPKHISVWNDWKYEMHDDEPRARFQIVRKGWGRLWSDRSAEITFLDPLWKRVWYGLDPLPPGSQRQAFPSRRRYD
jgi:hypothetical protein